MRRIEEKLGSINAPDGIREDLWFDVMIREINGISKDCAAELQKETNARWQKSGYTLDLYQAPPTRLLALTIAMASWLGWIMHEKEEKPDQLFSVSGCIKRTDEAYWFGVKLSETRQRP